MWARVCQAIICAALVSCAAFAQTVSPQGTFKIWNVNSDPTLQTANLLETVDDPEGLTAQVSGPAMVTISAGGFPSNGLLYWNPVTNAFKSFPVNHLGGHHDTLDVNRSTPSSGPPTFGGGDVWTSDPYVHFRGSNNFRSWNIGVRAGMGVRVNPADGKVYIANTIASGTGSIFELDPTTNAFRTWATGSSPWFLVINGNYVYATAANGGGYPDQIIRLDVATNTLTRWDVSPNSFYTANQFGVFNFITQDAEGQIWFSESAAGKIGRLNPVTNVLEEFAKPGMSLPSGMATTGVGPTLQTFFNDSNSNNVGLLAWALATPTNTSVVIPTVETVIPTGGTAVPTDFTVTPVTSVISPQTLTSTGVDPTGIFLFDVPTCSEPAGMSRVAFPETVFGSLQGPGCVYQFTSAAVVTSEPGMVTGGGFIAAPGGAATFGFNVKQTQQNGPISGQFEYHNHATGENVHSIAITSIFISGNTANFGGTCTNNAVPCTFNVTVQDNGEPGTGRDTFEIQGTVIVPEGGALEGGNIEIHPAQ